MARTCQRGIRISVQSDAFGVEESRGAPARVQPHCGTPHPASRFGLADPHNAGVSDAVFRAGWSGARLREPTESWYTAVCRDERASKYAIERAAPNTNAAPTCRPRSRRFGKRITGFSTRF